MLRPEDDIPVPAVTVTRLLTGIAYGTTLPSGHPAAISAEGAWRLAPATGTWSKPEPAFIGVLAQQRARQRRIAELTGLLEEKDTALAGLEDQLHELGARAARLEADLSARPDHRELDERRRDLDRAEEKVAANDEVVRDATGHLGRCERRVADALRTLSSRAAEHGLPTDRDRLRDLAAAVDGFRDHADSWVDACPRQPAPLSGTGGPPPTRTGPDAPRTRAREAAAAETKAAGAAARLEAVESTVGEDYRMVLARVDETRAELVRCRAEVRRAGELLVELEGRIGELNATSAQDVERREQAVAARDSAAHQFRHLCQAG
ncbi:hypothetical protein O1L55_05535 [Streptomyces albulus]|nr:hypothetical protein [Streptomyces noursei]